MITNHRDTPMHGMAANGVHKVVNRNTDSRIPRVLLSFHWIPATNCRAKLKKLGAIAGIDMIFQGVIRHTQHSRYFVAGCHSRSWAQKALRKHSDKKNESH